MIAHMDGRLLPQFTPYAGGSPPFASGSAGRLATSSTGDGDCVSDLLLHVYVSQ